MIGVTRNGLTVALTSTSNGSTLVLKLDELRYLLSPECEVQLSQAHDEIAALAAFDEAPPTQRNDG
jgi:hypothetical protein